MINRRRVGMLLARAEAFAKDKATLSNFAADLLIFHQSMNAEDAREFARMLLKARKNDTA